MNLEWVAVLYLSVFLFSLRRRKSLWDWKRREEPQLLLLILWEKRQNLVPGKDTPHCSNRVVCSSMNESILKMSWWCTFGNLEIIICSFCMPWSGQVSSTVDGRGTLKSFYDGWWWIGKVTLVSLTYLWYLARHGTGLWSGRLNIMKMERSNHQHSIISLCNALMAPSYWTNLTASISIETSSSLSVCVL